MIVNWIINLLYQTIYWILNIISFIILNNKWTSECIIDVIFLCLLKENRACRSHY